MKRSFVFFSFLLTSVCRAEGEGEALTPGAALPDPREDPGCLRERPHITVQFQGSFSESDKVAILSDLRAALSPQSMGVCALLSAPAEKSVALVTLTTQGQDLVRVEIRDSLTDKTVSRSIELGGSDAGSAALIVAVGADELLRATWAELSMRKAQGETDPPPEQIQTPPEGEKDPHVKLPSHRLALHGSVDVYAQGSTFWGADLSYGSHFGDVIEWTLFCGPRFSRDAEASSLGEAKAEAVSFGLSFLFPVVRAGSFFLGPALSVASTHAWYRGSADPANADVEEGEVNGWGVVVRGGAEMRLHRGRFFFGARTSLGAPVVRLLITDGSENIGGIAGMEWSSALGLGWSVDP